MAKFFRVRNYEKFQHYQDRTPPWIKLYNSLLDDYEFVSLKDASKLHLILIWLLASRTKNRIPFDADYLKQTLRTKTVPDLPELMKSKFIEEITMLQPPDYDASNTLSSCQQDACLEERRGEKNRIDEKRVEGNRSTDVTDQEFIESLKTNPAYTGIDVDREIAKCQTWCEVHGKTYSRRRVINWLNRSEKPMKAGPATDPKLNKNLAAIEEAQRRRDERRSFQQGDSDPRDVLPKLGS